MARTQVKRRLSGWTFRLGAGLVLGLGITRPLPALDWHPQAGARYATLTVREKGRTGFRLTDPGVTGIDFTNHLDPAFQNRNHNLLNGSGVALGDIDRDGWCDLYFCQLNGPNRLYRNLGNWRFEDATRASGLGLPNQLSRGAAFADLDGDGDLDLVVSSSHRGASVFFNDGRGRFQEVRTGLLSARSGATTLALADVEGDGDLDLYVTCYGENTIRSGLLFRTRRERGRVRVIGRLRNRLRIIDGQIVEFGEPDSLYLNDGKGAFTKVPWTSGRFLDETGRPLRAALWDLGLSAMFRDIDQDGDPDLYVCNDFGNPDRIWINQGKGRFRALPRPAIRISSHFSMGVDFADINRDGLDDFLVVDMLSRSHKLRMTQTRAPSPPIKHTLEPDDGRPQIRRNTLYLNRGDGTYAEIAYYAGVAASDWSWSPAFLDVDLDGFEDLLVVNGHAYDTQDLDTIQHNQRLPAHSPRRFHVTQFPPLKTPNAAFRNRGDLRFLEVGHAWGFDSKQVSHGMALGDLDNDGDLDVVINSLNARALVYRNETTAPRLAVRLQGREGNRQGIGARITVRSKGLQTLPTQSQEMVCGGRYLACDDAMRVFAAGSQTNVLDIEVRWRDGKRSFVAGARPNRIYQIFESDELEGGQKAVPVPGGKPSVFEDLSGRLGHRHIDPPFDDFARQPSLSRRLSQLGPGVAWCDVDADGWDDLIVGTGRGGTVAIYLNDRAGGFSAAQGFQAKAEPGDTAGLAVLSGNGNPARVFASVTNYELPAPNASFIRVYSNDGRTAEIQIPDARTRIGPLAFADVDRDGDLDLFVGGRSVRARYPEAASSYLFKNQSELRFQRDIANAPQLDHLGLVRGAVFSDVDQDGDADLVLACEWDSPRLFLNHNGVLTDRSEAWNLEGYRGWWNGVATGDFNGDGRPDLILSNWGLNTSYDTVRDGPIQIHFGDVNGDETTECVESYQSDEIGGRVPFRMRDTLAREFPWIRRRYPTQAAFREATIEDLLGDHLPAMKVREVNTLEAMVFLNQGNRFAPSPLPREAQLAPSFAVCVADIDSDGFEDVFLSQNFSGMESELGRFNAGRGLWLRGNGRGGFSAMTAKESGVMVYGDQRGAAVADFDRDGRVDLVVTQNRGETRLLRNRSPRRGLRIRIRGGERNPMGVGAAIRLVGQDGMGPLREIQAGSGYGSQNSPVQVMSLPGPVKALWVRWPDGRTITVPVPPEAEKVEIEKSGKMFLH